MFFVATKRISHLLMLTSFILHNTYSSEVNDGGNSGVYKIGIIGGGIGGTATAYFLKNAFKDNVSLHLYESKTIGGRLAVSSKFDLTYETGGTIIHPLNTYMNTFVKEFGLEKKNYICDSRVGIFDGEEYSFIESDWDIMNAIKTFWRYGLDVYSLKKQNDKMLNSFYKIYDHQRKGLAFKSVDDLLYSMDPGFPPMAKQSLESFLKERKFHDKIINEIASAFTRANYGQIPTVHAFVGAISVAAANPDIWSVFGGNKKVAEELLKHSGAQLHKKHVAKISQLPSGKFKVWSKTQEREEEQSDEFDSLVIAAPLTKDKSDIELVDFSPSLEFPGRFQRVVATMVQGSLNETTFKFKEVGVTVEDILTNNPALMYTSIGLQHPINSTKCRAGVDVFKVFSPDILTEEQLSLLFKSYDKTEVIDWLAYPHYPSVETLPRIELVPGLYYNNAIEKAGSAMEMSVISAKNTALLVQYHLMGTGPEEPVGKQEL